MGTITRNFSKQINSLDGDVERYSELAKKNQEVYRSLNGFIASRLKELNKETKRSLYVRLGVADGTLNDWEQKGITEMKQAYELAIALKLDGDSVVDFIQKEAGRGIYLADEEHFRYVYILQHREDLEKKYPYEKGETVIQWTNRVKPLLPVKKSVYEEWMETEIFKKVVITGNLEQTHILPFRSAGEKALAFLYKQIKDTPFEDNYGNTPITYIKIDPKKIEKNVSMSRNIFFKKEKKFFERIIKQLCRGEIPHRYDITKLGMILRLNYEQMNELLELCEENTLYARNVYEGALINVWKFLSEMRPEWFEEKNSFLFANDLENLEQKEKIFVRDYEAEDEKGGPIDFCVLASQQVEKALEGLQEKEFKKILKERPSWYLNRKEQKLRIEQKRLSTIFFEMMARLQMIRNRVIENQRSYVVDDKNVEIWVSPEVFIQIDYSLMSVTDKLEEDYGYESIEEDVDVEIKGMMKDINAEWMLAVKNDNLLGANTDIFTKFKEQMYKKMEELYDSYSIAYLAKLDAPKTDEEKEIIEDGYKTVV